MANLDTDFVPFLICSTACRYTGMHSPLMRKRSQITALCCLVSVAALQVTVVCPEAFD